MVRATISTWLMAISLLVLSCGHASGPGQIEPEAEGELATATFAGGCFWCMEKPFDQLDGVVKTVSGYTGGDEKSPSYEQVSAGRTGHVEAIRVIYDPSRVGYERLLDTYWRSINPTQTDGQFADRGDQYKTAIFYHSDEQRRAAEASKAELDRSGKFSRPVYTKIFPAKTFWRAEEYHQDYYLKNPADYLRYYRGSGRAAYLAKTWK